MREETLASENARLYNSDLHELTLEPVVFGDGAIVLCKSGSAEMMIDFKRWELHTGAVITLFPQDVVLLRDKSADFRVELLRFDKALLREASLQLEQTVYSSLRADRCRKDRPIVTDIIEGMFNLLRIYFRQDDCTCLDQLVLYQLKAFFLGFYDYLYRHKNERPDDEGSHRTNEVFNAFMELLEQDYILDRNVSHFAEKLHISPKYLNTIIRRKTGHSAKSIIDQYVIMQVKLLLRTREDSVKQITYDFHFSDVSFFCRYFKAHTGTTPQEFRKAQKTGK